MIPQTINQELLEACELALAYIVAQPARLTVYPGPAPFDPCQLLRERISKAYTGDHFAYLRRPELTHLQKGI